MPRTIDEGFRDFLTKLTPTGTESESAKSHRASIEACLAANFNLQRFFRTGSFGNGTSISGYSDVDYFASIPADKLSDNSTTALARVRDVLDKRFPNTGVRVNCPAVKVPFGAVASESTEVVPAIVASLTKDKHIVYKIPDCAGGWMRSSPDAHNAYVRDIDQKLDSKVKPLIRFIKAWKYYQQVPILSFYLEMRVAHYAYTQSSIVYSIDVKVVFDILNSAGLAPLIDPTGISGNINSCSTQTKLDEAKSKLATALSRAEKACEAERKGNVKDAFDWWNLVFNDNFPGYYR